MDASCPALARRHAKDLATRLLVAGVAVSSNAVSSNAVSALFVAGTILGIMRLGLGLNYLLFLVKGYCSQFLRSRKIWRKCFGAEKVWFESHSYTQRPLEFKQK
jgi:hypothetical protein